MPLRAARGARRKRSATRHSGVSSTMARNLRRMIGGSEVSLMTGPWCATCRRTARWPGQRSPSASNRFKHKPIQARSLASARPDPRHAASRARRPWFCGGGCTYGFGKQRQVIDPRQRLARASRPSSSARRTSPARSDHGGGKSGKPLPPGSVERSAAPGAPRAERRRCPSIP